MLVNEIRDGLPPTRPCIVNLGEDNSAIGVMANADSVGSGRFRIHDEILVVFA